MAAVMTVLGPVAPADLGITLPHEHLLLDLSCLWHHAQDPDRAYLAEATVSRDLHPILLRDPYHCKDNLRLGSVDTALEELAHFAALGGRTVVDLSSRMIGPYPVELAAIARRTGLHIVAGCGFYIRRAHPAWLADRSVEELAALLIAELMEGFADDMLSTAPEARGLGALPDAHRHKRSTGEAPRQQSGRDDGRPRAGIIGEMGTSTPIDPREEKALRAAALAHLATGAAINVHLAIFGREGLRVLEILEQHGVDPRRVALSHLDENLDAAYHLAIARRGAYLEFDTFGSECFFDEGGLREPTDGERIDALLRLLDAGFGRQMLLSQDVCTKMHLHRYGGVGYDHLLRTIVPRLRARGVPEALLTAMLVENPARLLEPRVS